MTRIGLISDTHGLLRGEASAYLRGCDLIVHAGDIGGPSVLEGLQLVAPVCPVRGNVDHGDWCREIPEQRGLHVEALDLHVVHNIAHLDAESLAAEVRVVIYGHSHQPASWRRDRVWYINPGSAGPRRFRLPIALGTLLVDGRQARLETRQLAQG